MLEVRDITVRYGRTAVLDSFSVSVEEGQWLMMAGPNGAGKSTTLGAIACSIPCTGRLLFDGRDLKAMRSIERARLTGVLTQNHYVGYSFSVEEVVRLGRYSHSTGLFSKKDRRDDEAVEYALSVTGMEKQRSQSVLTLSGGELQRTFLAQVFAQEPRLLLLDEPTNHLDLIYQKQIFALIRDWLRGPGRAVISVVHDLSLAKAYGTHAVLLDRGKTVANGTVGEVFRPEHLDPVYGMDVSGWMGGLLSAWEKS